MVDTGLCLTIKIFDWFLAEDHQIYKQNKVNINNINIQEVLTTLDKSNVFEGVATEEKSGELLLNFLPQNGNIEDNSDDDTQGL